ncbi:MAG: NADPH:quinone reductase [Thermoleophilaceae bacterium]
MLAAFYETTGASDVLRVGELSRPDPGPGEVLVRVTVSGVNPTDWKSRSGATGGVAEGAPFQVPNQDGAGMVEAVGEGVDGARIGERVWIFFAAWQRPWGTAAQYTVVPSEQAVELPGGAADDLGASLGIPAMTAHRCLHADGPIEGRTVLVAGGAGAVGHAAIELARFAGARVVATVSTEEKAELARAAGAHETVNYHADDAADSLREAAPDGIDRVVELDLAQNIELDLAAAAPHATIASYAGESCDATLAIRDLMVPNIVLRFVLVYGIPAAAVAEAVAGVTDALGAGALTTLPLHRFALGDTAAAHDAVEAGAVGKVLIDVA